MNTIIKIIYSIVFFSFLSSILIGCVEYFDKNVEIPEKYSDLLNKTGYSSYVYDNVDKIRYTEKVVQRGKRWGGIAYVGRNPRVIDVSTVGSDLFVASTIVHESAHHAQYYIEQLSTEKYACTVQSTFLNDLLTVTEEYMSDWQGAYDSTVEYGGLELVDGRGVHGSFGIETVNLEGSSISGISIKVILTDEIREIITNSEGYANFYMLPFDEDTVFETRLLIDGSEIKYSVGNNTDNKYIIR